MSHLFSRKQSIDDDTAASESDSSVTHKGILKTKSRDRDAVTGKRRVSFFEPSIVRWKGGPAPRFVAVNLLFNHFSKVPMMK